MNPVDAYLAQVKGAMAGMEPRVRDDILRELRSHLAESAAANGGDAVRAIEGMGSPVRVGREYRRLYGYGRAYTAVFALVAAVCAALSLPVFGGTLDASGVATYLPNLLSLPFLVAAVVWLLWVSVQAGSRTGLLAGLGAFAGRIGATVALGLSGAGGVLTADGVTLLVLSSVLLVALGWLPGTAKKAWSRPGADL